MSYGCYHANWREVGRGGNDLINGIKLSARSGARVLIGPLLCVAWLQCCWLVKWSIWWGPCGWSQCENRYSIYLSRVWQQMHLGSDETSCKSGINMRYHFCCMPVFASMCLSGIWTVHSTQPRIFSCSLWSFISRLLKFGSGVLDINTIHKHRREIWKILAGSNFLFHRPDLSHQTCPKQHALQDPIVLSLSLI